MTNQDDRHEPLRRSPLPGPHLPAEPETDDATPVESTEDTSGRQEGRTSQPQAPGETFRVPPGSGIPLDAHAWGSPTPIPNAVEPVPAPIPIPTRNAYGGSSNTVRIGLWGSPRSGKTTVISALPIAAMQGVDPSRNWIVSGVGNQATTILTEGVDRMVNQRRFPAPTDSVDPIMWSFQGEDNGGSSRLSRLIRRPPIDFALELQDVKGEYYRAGSVDSRVVENLAMSNGIIYLFDPVLETHEDLRSFNFFYSVLQQVTSRVRDEGGFDEGRLPGHVSVLVTKFDDPAFFESAVQAGWVNPGEGGARIPYVKIAHGPAFFDWVCRARQGGTAVMVRDALRNFFHQDRIEYFACSAIGFRLNPHGVFDYADYGNVESVDGDLRIRSLVRPVNVLEPLIRLEHRIRRRRRAALR